jgi:hypothetical protein
MTTEQRIAWNFYESDWCVIRPESHDYPVAGLDALVASGKLTRIEEVTIYCPEGHAWWVGSAANAPAYRECNHCDGPGDPEDYTEVTEVRYLIADSWRALLQSHVRECEHCGGTGRIIPPRPEAA